MSGGREIDKAIEKLESEIRMLKLRVSELADEQPATVAPDALESIDPSRLLSANKRLGEAYRLLAGEPYTHPSAMLLRDTWRHINDRVGTTPDEVHNILMGVRS